MQKSPDAILNKLERYLSDALKKKALQLSNSHRDGRSNSSEDERSISSALQYYVLANDEFKQNMLSIEIARPRYWYDFLIKNNDETVWLPVNVKVSTMRGQDNISSKEGLFYAVTGKRPGDIPLNTWEKYCEAVAEHLNPETSADYYFLVVSKNNLGHVFWTSLKQINNVAPNGNNPPFQCAWKDNQTRVTRPSDEAVTKLLMALGETFRLRAEAYNSYKKILAPLLEENLPNIHE